jgi:hypothetical protein
MNTNLPVLLLLVSNIVWCPLVEFCSLTLGSVPSDRESERGGKKGTTPRNRWRNLYPFREVCSRQTFLAGD